MVKATRAFEQRWAAYSASAGEPDVLSNVVGERYQITIENSVREQLGIKPVATVDQALRV